MLRVGCSRTQAAHGGAEGTTGVSFTTGNSAHHQTTTCSARRRLAISYDAVFEAYEICSTR